MLLFTENHDYVEAERLLRRLHQIIAAGEGSSDEANEIREEASSYWGRLTLREQRRLQRLSAELKMFTGDEVAHVVRHPKANSLKRKKSSNRHAAGKPGKPNEEMRLRLLIKQQWNARRFEGVLETLRAHPSLWSAEDLAALRASAYRHLGHVDTSLLFLSWVAERRPTRHDYQILINTLLVELGRMDEAIARAKAFIGSEAVPSSLLLSSAMVLWQSISGSRAEMNTATAGEILEAVERSLRQPLDSLAKLPSLKVAAFVMLSVVRRRLGDYTGALAASNEGLALMPQDPNLLVMRGILRMASDTNAAVIDFAAAVDAQVQLELPYFFLGNYLLHHGEYFRLLHVSVAGLQVESATRKTRAILMSWQAIAQFELGAPRRVVEALFEMAISTDPANEIIRRNKAAFIRITEERLRSNRTSAPWAEPDTAELESMSRLAEPPLSYRFGTEILSSNELLTGVR